MSYVEKNLIADEKIIYKGGLHWIVLAVPILIGGLLILRGLLTMTTGIAGIMTGLVIACVGAVMILLGFISRNAAEMVLTDRRVVVKTGILRRKTVELFLPKVESIQVDQGLLGQMLDYGTIVVKGTGGTSELFKRMGSPLEFRRLVQHQSEASLVK